MTVSELIDYLMQFDNPDKTLVVISDDQIVGPDTEFIDLRYVPKFL